MNKAATDITSSSKYDLLNPYSLSLEQLKTQQKLALVAGLSQIDADERKKIVGPNSLPRTKKLSRLQIFLHQFQDTMVIVLIVAGIIAGFLNESVDAIAIFVIVFLNALLGYFQESKAEDAMQALLNYSSSSALVLRDARHKQIPVEEIVPGDITIIEAGNFVPADMRLINSHNIIVDESSLTGESMPVEKNAEVTLGLDSALPDRKNMVYKGTLVVGGRATGIVTATGLRTEFGKIAKLLSSEAASFSPLQKRMKAFAKKLTAIVIILCVIMFFIGISRGENPLQMFLTALSLAVAAIPEALPAVITSALALGARRMASQKALIRRLSAVESLGSVTVICTDKTGTLTQNKMHVEKVFLASETFHSNKISNAKSKNILSAGLALNNDSRYIIESSCFEGEATENALLAFAKKIDSGIEKIQKESPRIFEIPFSSERAMMSTFHRNAADQKVIQWVKGAPEKVLPLCKKMLSDHGSTEFSNEEVTKVLENFTQSGFRVLAIAFREHSVEKFDPHSKNLEEDLCLVALVGLVDPPRPEVFDSVRDCKSAGVKVVMITGDHPLTAKYIAHQLKIIDDLNAQVLSGSELLAMSDDDFTKQASNIHVYARMSPEQKIKIVTSLQNAGEIVCMTGDGVNDAPSLKRSDVGVSMGLNGTDVAREASQMILLDDNFSSIVKAIREGRRIYDNIRKFIRFAISGNSAEVWTLFLAPLIGLPIPLLPIQILWVNLVTDGLPGLALSMEEEEKNIMSRAPTPKNESLFARGLGFHALWVGLFTAALTLGTMAWALNQQMSEWQSMAFCVLTFSQFFHVLAIRSETESVLNKNLFKNPYLWASIIFNFVAQALILNIPFLQKIFKLQALDAKQWVICLGVSSLILFAVEFEKFWRRPRQNPSPI